MLPARIFYLNWTSNISFSRLQAFSFPLPASSCVTHSYLFWSPCELVAGSLHPPAVSGQRWWELEDGEDWDKNCKRNKLSYERWLCERAPRGERMRGLLGEQRVVLFGITPRVLFVLIQFSGDMEHGMRNRIYLGWDPRRKSPCEGTRKGFSSQTTTGALAPLKTLNLFKELLKVLIISV